MRIARDEDCPKCDFPETYIEAYEDKGVVGIGCRKCGWWRAAQSEDDSREPGL